VELLRKFVLEGNRGVMKKIVIIKRIALGAILFGV